MGSLQMFPLLRGRSCFKRRLFLRGLSNYLDHLPRLSLPFDALGHTLWQKQVRILTQWSLEGASPVDISPLRDISSFEFLKVLLIQKETCCGVPDNHQGNFVEMGNKAQWTRYDWNLGRSIVMAEGPSSSQHDLLLFILPQSIYGFFSKASRDFLLSLIF